MCAKTPFGVFLEHTLSYVLSNNNPSSGGRTKIVLPLCKSKAHAFVWV